MSATAVPTPNPTSAAWSVFLDSQSFNVTGLDGTPTTLSLVDIDLYVYMMVVAGVVYGFCVGFVGMQIIVLVMLTDAKKIRRPIIVLNLVSLVLFEIRALMNTIELCAPFFTGIGETFIGAVAQYTVNPYIANTLALFIQPFLYISIIASLILQVRVVFGSEIFVRKIITIFLCFFGSVLVAFEITYCVYNIIANFQEAVTVNEPAWLYPVTEDLFLTFLGISSLIFLYKLAVTIRMRRRLGLKRFGPLQILFIMSAQCLVIPVLFYVLSDTVISSDVDLQSIGQAFVICSLPLSTLWASAESGTSQQPSSFAGAYSTTTSNVTVESRNSKFRRFWPFKKSSDSHSSYSDDIEKTREYSPNAVQVHTTLQVQSFDKY